ncbi:TetR family transcriptional regulator C-terminal domain-containing protein [uncultured Hymenobacter sp.]|uniref:TetR family transcriptional regulator C-terminal domain-containing protein n=1 Tax=uncultured Hymenobacter sp. TaxID=170016 RepID=UPI0035CAB88B
MDKAQIKQAYLDFVRLENQPPASVYIFTNKLGIPEAEFYQFYPNFAAIDRDIWADYGRQAREKAALEPVWATYGAREKLLAFYYTLLELLKQNRSYALLSLRRSLSRMPGQVPRVLEDFEREFKDFALEILDQGRRSGEVASRAFITQGYPRFFYRQALFVLGYFAKDESVNFERTDAAVEKAVTLSFDLVGRNSFDSAIDFVRFLAQRRR